MLKKRTDRPIPIIASASLGKTFSLDGVKKDYEVRLSKPFKRENILHALESVFKATPEAQANMAFQMPIAIEKLASTHPLRILLAEDNTVNQRMFEITLERLGFSVELASTGRQVLNMLENRSFDVILMDMHMPEMDGLDATRHIVANWDESERPFIFALTAAVMQEDRDRCYSAGMQSFLTKPLQIEELISVLKSVKPLSKRSRNHADQKPIVRTTSGPIFKTGITNT